MAKKKDLSNQSTHNYAEAADWQVGIVCSDWNSHITSKLLDGCKAHLSAEGISEDHIKSINVPGAFELTIGAKLLLRKYPELNAVIALGCVIKGSTDHDKYINQSVASGLTQLGIVSNKPCIFGLLTVNDEEQAEERSGGSHGNKGIEAAATAISMMKIAHDLNKTKSTIGF